MSAHRSPGRQPPPSKDLMDLVSLRKQYDAILLEGRARADVLSKELGLDAIALDLLKQLNLYGLIPGGEQSVAKYIKLLDNITNPTHVIYKQIELLAASAHHDAIFLLHHVHGTHNTIITKLKEICNELLSKEESFVKSVHSDTGIVIGEVSKQYLALIQEHHETCDKATTTGELMRLLANITDPTQESHQLCNAIDVILSEHIHATRVDGHNSSINTQGALRKLEVGAQAIITEYYGALDPAEAARKLAEEAEAARKLAEEAEAARKLAEETEAAKKLAEEAEAARKLVEETEAAKKLVEETEAAKKLAEEQQKKGAIARKYQKMAENEKKFVDESKDLFKIEGYNLSDKVAAKKHFVEQYINHLADQTIRGKNSSYVVKMTEGTLLHAMTMKLEQAEIVEYSDSVCNSKGSNSMKNSEFNQAIGQIELIEVRKIAQSKFGMLKDKDEMQSKIKDYIMQHIQTLPDAIKLATEIAYVEDALFQNEGRYEDIQVSVRDVIPNTNLLTKFWHPTVEVEKVETLFEFYEENILHAYQDMHSENIGVGLQYIEHCIHELHHPTAKVGAVIVVIDMTH